MSSQIAIMCMSGTREKLQMAAMVASVAAASGDRVFVFFSMNALVWFVKGHATHVPAEGEFGTLLTQKGVPPFKQLFQQAVELGDAELLPCSMAVDLLKITENDLDSEFSSPMGLTKFLSLAAGGHLLTF